MNTVILCSISLLWLVVLAVAVLIMQLNRKVSQLLITVQQTAPTIEMPKQILVQDTHGVPHGEPFPELEFTDVLGQQVSLVQPDTQGVLVAFTSVGCDMCKNLYPQLLRFLKRNPQFGSLMFMEGQAGQLGTVIADYNLTMPVIRVTGEDMRRLDTGFFPFVYFLDPDGRVISKSLVNFEDQLDLLVNVKPLQ